jgi:T5SS/PEP-CTERM-associated repeat protein
MKRDMTGGVMRTCLLMFLSSAAATPAIAKNWADGTSNWNVPANWSPAAVPGVGEAVNIVNTDGTARTVTLNVSPPALGLLTIDLTGAGTAADTLSITSNVSLTSGAMFVGGYSGSAATAGRGAVVQSAGAVAMASGLDLALAYGGPGTSPATAASTGTYTLSGTGTFTAPQSEFIGYGGSGTFNQSGGTNTINSGSIGAFYMGTLTGSTGTYNLSAGQLLASKSEYVGEVATGIFNQTGGINTLSGTNSLYISHMASGTGTYTASGSASLNVGGDVNVGVSGAGTLNVQGNANVSITGNLNIGAADHVNLSSGTLRFNGYSRDATGVFNFTGGRVQLASARSMNSDSAIADLFGGANPTIANGHNLTVEGAALVDASSPGGTVTVSNANFVSQGQLSVGYDTSDGTLNITNGSTVTNAGVIVGDKGTGSFNYNHGIVNVDSSVWNTGAIYVGKDGQGTVSVTNGGYVVSSSVAIGFDTNGPNTDLDTILVSGPGSTLISNDFLSVGGLANSKLTIENGANVYVNNNLDVQLYSEVDMNGGTLRFGTLNLTSIGQTYDAKLNYNGGTIQFANSRNVGTDADIQRLYGFLPVIPTGKGLTIENTMTLSTALRLDGGSLKAFSLNVVAGGSLDFDGGIFELTGGPVTGLNSLGVPTGGEFRALGSYSFRVAGAADSLITATGDLTIGNASAVNGFGTQGTVNVGANSVTLLDANDVVFDSLSLATLGNGASPGTLSAANGLTLDFGGNITGYGTVSTPNNAAKPTIINGHIAGDNSTTQKITLSGYVKGAGTFDNVTFTGTFSPGFSPTLVIAGSLSFGSTNTLIMELGGTTPGSTYDQIQASGALGLDGILQISLINGFNPAAGQSFDILNWGSISGTFSSINLPALIAGLTWNTSQLYTTGVLSVAGVVGTPGDYNNNGTVEAGDYVLYRKYAGTTHVLPNDPTGGAIGTAQYTTWRSHFGQPPGSGSGTTGSVPVPEPTMLVLLMFAAVSRCLLRSRGRIESPSNSSTLDTCQ